MGKIKVRGSLAKFDENKIKRDDGGKFSGGGGGAAKPKAGPESSKDWKAKVDAKGEAQPAHDTPRSEHDRLYPNASEAHFKEWNAGREGRKTNSAAEAKPKGVPKATKDEEAQAAEQDATDQGKWRGKKPDPTMDEAESMDDVEFDDEEESKPAAEAKPKGVKQAPQLKPGEGRKYMEVDTPPGKTAPNVPWAGKQVKKIRVVTHAPLAKFDESAVESDMDHLIDGTKVDEGNADKDVQALSEDDKEHIHESTKAVNKVRVVTRAPLLKEASVCPLCKESEEACKCTKSMLFKAYSDMVATSSVSLAPATDHGAVNQPAMQKA